ncbi:MULTISPECIES: nicotinamide riboside transporter PnuC [unclassified Novosphingobium]|uniref:nicotinamide riboside transporter PnuC n=1 Tax=unclassified Novosphingobium TaxID=2644732 RepID=UPI0025DDA3C9|nr:MULTISPECIES: nicotinamide riboside transporter PnuC [unclassified Novosphingobium]HQV02142.1 nicotinamide riboside transporter PnuC [Novosphingobium sp.]
MGGGAGMILSAETLKALEWAAMALGLINIALLIFRSQWNFAFAIASVTLYVFIFFESRLYAESGLQVFFILANVWGWVLWHRAAQSGLDDSRVPVRWLDWQSRAVWLTVTAAISLNLGWVMHRYTNAAMPFADSAIAGASVAAQILLGYRRIENWVLWIVIDVAAVLLYINRGLYPTAGLYGGMLVMSLFGLKEWIEVERRQRAEA